MAMHGIKIAVSVFALLVTNVYCGAHGGTVVRISQHTSEDCSEASLTSELYETTAVVTLKTAMFDALGFGAMFPNDVYLIPECTADEYVKTYYNDPDGNEAAMMPAESQDGGCTKNGRRLAAHISKPTTGYTKVTCDLTFDLVTFDIFGDAGCSADKWMEGGQSAITGCTKTSDDGYENFFCSAEGTMRGDKHAVSGCTDATSSSGDDLAGMDANMCFESPEGMMDMPMYIKPTAGLPCTPPSTGGDDASSDAMVTAKLGWVAAAAVGALFTMQQ